MRPDYDCVVVGAGLTGTTLAIALDQLGIRTALIEARDLSLPSGTPVDTQRDQRGLALSLTSQRILDTLGLWQSMRDSATPIRHVHVSDKGHFGVTRLAADELGFDALGFVCPATTLADQLLAQLTQRTTIDTFAPARVIALAPGSDRVEVRVSVDSMEHVLHAKLIVAADGSGSPTRELLGIATQDFDYRRSAVVANVSVRRPRAETAFERFTPDGPVALLPMGGSRYVAVLTVDNDDAHALRNGASSAFLNRLQRRFGDRLGEFFECGTRSVFPLKLSRAQAIATSRAVILGNAANTVHPNAAQGLNLGLRDVATLVDCIVEARASTDKNRFDAGSPTVVEPYRTARARDQRRVVRFTDLLAHVFATHLFPVAQTRSLAMLGIDVVPSLKAAFARRTMGMSGCMSRLACGIPLPKN